MRSLKSNWILIILLILFLLPGVSACWFYLHPQLLTGKLVNKGQLMNTLVLVPELRESKTWQLVYVPEKGCDERCIMALTQLAKIRLSLGRHLYGLSLHVLLKDSEQAASPFNTQLNEVDIHLNTLTERPPQLKPYQVWIVNPEGYVVMAYRDESNPKDIFSDLKHFSTLWDQTT